MGGISKFEDIIEFLRSGSTMVQIGTLNYRSPGIICSFYNQLKDFLIKSNIDNINQLIGNYNK